MTMIVAMLSCSSDDTIHPQDIIVGEWTVEKYEINPNDFGELTWKTINCDANGKFTVFNKYEEPVFEGNYEIGDDYLRLDYKDDSNNQQRILAQIMSCTTTTLALHYKDSENDIEVTLWISKKRC